MPMSPFQYTQYGVPGFQPQTMQQMVGQGYSPAPSFHPQPGISGRVVTSPGEIQVQEVPTDGTVAWFPAADGSCVWGKRWTPDGSIQTVRYVAEAQEAAPQADPVAQIDAKLDRALSMLGHILGEDAWATATSTATGPPTRPTDAAACAVAATPRSRSRTSAP